MTLETITTWLDELGYLWSERATDSIWIHYPAKRMGAIMEVIVVSDGVAYLSKDKIDNKEELEYNLKTKLK
jgi:hypothetical protein